MLCADNLKVYWIEQDAVVWNTTQIARNSLHFTAKTVASLLHCFTIFRRSCKCILYAFFLSFPFPFCSCWIAILCSLFLALAAQINDYAYLFLNELWYLVIFVVTFAFFCRNVCKTVNVSIPYSIQCGALYFLKREKKSEWSYYFLHCLCILHRKTWKKTIERLRIHCCTLNAAFRRRGSREQNRTKWVGSS